MGTQATANKNDSGVLNVLFHGAFTFVKKKKANKILALVPHMRHHVFRAGNWLAEIELRGQVHCDEAPPVYELIGVKSEETFAIPAQNLIVKYDSLPNDVGVYATIKLPFPRQITALRVGSIPTSTFEPAENRKKLKVQGASQPISTLQVFTYEIDKENSLQLGGVRGNGHYWEPVFVHDDETKRDYVNLHVFSAEDHFHKFSSPQEDINQCLDLLGVDLQVNTRFLPAGEIDDPNDLPFGVSAPETEELAVRTRRLARLGRLVSQRADANLAWHGNDALDGDPHACSPVWGGDDGN